MLVQYLTILSERNQHIMISLFFLIFIIYSLYSALFIGLLLGILIMLSLAIGVYFLFKAQLKNRVVVQPQIYFQTSKQKSLKRSLKWRIIPFIIYTLLTILHFLIVYLAEKSLIPLVYDYGIGGVLAIGLNFFMSKNWNVGICEEGLILGSKLDSKLVLWKEIISIDYSEKVMKIKFEKHYPLQELLVKDEVNLPNFKKLLEYKRLYL